MAKCKLILSKYAQYVAALGILTAIIFGNRYSWEMVTGWREPLWAAEGLVMTNKNLKFLMAFIVTGLGIPLVVYRVFGRERISLMVSLLIIIPAVMTMALTRVTLWGIPLLITITYLSILFLEKKGLSFSTEGSGMNMKVRLRRYKDAR